MLNKVSDRNKPTNAAVSADPGGADPSPADPQRPCRVSTRPGQSLTDLSLKNVLDTSDAALPGGTGDLLARVFRRLQVERRLLSPGSA